jgi:hypothetical protein
MEERKISKANAKRDYRTQQDEQPRLASSLLMQREKGDYRTRDYDYRNLKNAAPKTATMRNHQR